MKIYIDSKKRCHTTNSDGDFREFDVPFFDGKCKEFVEGFIFCPKDESYVRDDGDVFYGECIVPWKPYDELDAAQREYERQLLAEYEESLKVMGVTL